MPGEILQKANAHKVRYYRANLAGGYAFTVWAWPYQLIVMDDKFLSNAPPSVIRYVLAHELGHCVLGHTWKKWIATVLGAVLVPRVRTWIMVGEDQADDFAEKLSGVPRSVIRNPEEVK